MSGKEYQKIEKVIKGIATDLLLLKVGDRLTPISNYQEKYGVARGTVQNAISFLKKKHAIELEGKGHSGTFIRKIDYSTLQEYSSRKRIMGVLPILSSYTFYGLSTALNLLLRDLNCDFAYSRGSESRIRMVVDGNCEFAICSKLSANMAIESGLNIKILANFGKKSYHSNHALVFRNHSKTKIEPGMKILIDTKSIDHAVLINNLIKDINGVILVKTRFSQTLQFLKKEKIDVSLWNYDELGLTGFEGFNVVPLEIGPELEDLSTAVMIVRSDDEFCDKVLRKYIDLSEFSRIQKGVIEKIIEPNW
ncbi:MAG TPA: GntR family transcriptional regulator YhfZ [Erysipelotrichaceae bacterium]|nr:hypothetical protein [Erysipelotrichia bacterium]HPX32221.1 GntR family transcriptional regulator YhfZ [Erysipelotrichaceae bacterium]HQA85025.1 GntR family transcriptional regulator YhfZ [Erysipelotrichaceae bacterium]